MSRPSPSEYPVSAPYHRPVAGSAESSGFRLWSLAFLAATALLLVTTVAAAVFWANWLYSEDEHKLSAEQPAGEVTPAVKDSKPAAARKETPPSPPAAEKAGATSEERLKMLDALHTLSAAHLYQTFTNIGVLSDAVDSETYSIEKADQMLTTVQALSLLIDEHLVNLKGMDLDAESRQGIDQIRKTTALLRRQATALRTYWATGEQAEAERYHAARDEASKIISKLLSSQQ